MVRCSGAVGLLAVCSFLALAAGQTTTGITFEDDAHGTTTRVFFDGQKLHVPGYCESGTCSTLSTAVEALKTAVGSLQVDMGVMQKAIEGVRAGHAADIAELRDQGEELERVDNATALDLRTLSQRVLAANEVLTTKMASARAHHNAQVDALRQRFEDLEASGARTNLTLTLLATDTATADRALNASIANARLEHRREIAALQQKFEDLSAVDVEDQLKLAQLSNETKVADYELQQAIERARAEHAATVAGIRERHNALDIAHNATSADVAVLRARLQQADSDLAKAINESSAQHDRDVDALKAADALLQIADASIRTAVETLAADTSAADAALTNRIGAAEQQHVADVKALQEVNMPQQPQYELKSVGSCDAPIGSAAECLKAANTLSLGLGAPESNNAGPDGCYMHGSAKLAFAAAGTGQQSGCSLAYQCVCHKTPSTVPDITPQVPATPLHMPTTPAAHYFLTTQGVCDMVISTRAECEHAAKMLGLSDTVAETDGMAWGYDPTGCYFEDGALKFNEHGNTGLCSLSDECICKR